MSDELNLPQKGQVLRDELLLLLLDLRHKKNGICLVLNTVDFRQRLCNDFVADLVCFWFLFRGLVNFMFLGKGPAFS